MPSQGIIHAASRDQTNQEFPKFLKILIEWGDDMHKLIFACFAADRNDASKALLLAESIRTFSGDATDVPFLLMTPGSNAPLTHQQHTLINQLGVDLNTFEIDAQAASFPFAGKVVASAAAETISEGKCDQLVWMDNAALVVNPVDQLLLEPGIRLGYRPVDHLLVGSPYDKPLDPFWDFVYHACGVSESDVFPMVTSTDQVRMRPYINAGMLVVRPGDKLLRLWRDTFLETYQDSKLREIYKEEQLYKIFIHQAILAACVMTSYHQSDTSELPHVVNYPLHMHSQYPAQLRPASLNMLVSFRYEGFFADPKWQERIQVEQPLEGWLRQREKMLARR
jgi:hypothetical protein